MSGPHCCSDPFCVCETEAEAHDACDCWMTAEDCDNPDCCEFCHGRWASAVAPAE